MTRARVIAVLVAVVTSVMVSPAPARARDAMVASFDGTPIAVHFFPAAGLKKGTRAPLVMLAHGYGEKGPSERNGPRLAGAPTVSALLGAGYNVLSWDARGHGNSGGTAMFDSPDYEVRDTRRLIDWAARQPEVLLDRPGDPRVGMTGASYGGIIQLLTAAVDRRVDVISPAYTANSLLYTLAPDGAFKQTWAAFLLGAGAQTLPPGISTAGIHPHTLDPEAISGLAEGVATGRMPNGFARYLAARDPAVVLDRIRIPTLLQQGTSDNLFSLEHARRTYAALRRNGVPAKVMWNCEGHSICLTSTGPPGKFDATAIRWFDRWLKRNRSVDTGPVFEWLADNESTYRSATAYPPTISTWLRGTGAGALALSPALSSGGGGVVLVGGRPAPDAVSIDIAPPAGPRDVVGAPRVALTYSGTAIPAETFLFAQVVDVETDRVVGTQVTAIPVTLDGARHTVTRALNPIATRAGPASRYRVQILPGSLLFGAQRSAGVVTLDRVDASLPVIGSDSR